MRFGRSLLTLAAALALSWPAQAQPVQTLLLGSAVTSTGVQTAIRARPQEKGPASAWVSGATSSSTGSATIAIEVSLDNTTFVVACTITLSLSTTTTADGCTLNAAWEYVRMNVTAITGTGASVDGRYRS